MRSISKYFLKFVLELLKYSTGDLDLFTCSFPWEDWRTELQERSEHIEERRHPDQLDWWSPEPSRTWSWWLSSWPPPSRCSGWVPPAGRCSSSGSTEVSTARESFWLISDQKNSSSSSQHFLKYFKVQRKTSCKGILNTEKKTKYKLGKSKSSPSISQSRNSKVKR